MNYYAEHNWRDEDREIEYIMLLVYRIDEGRCEITGVDDVRIVDWYYDSQWGVEYRISEDDTHMHPKSADRRVRDWLFGRLERDEDAIAACERDREANIEAKRFEFDERYT